MTVSLTTNDYHVGIICALPKELKAVKATFDERHPRLKSQRHADHNIYQLGRIGEHNVVATCLPAGDMGTNSAATAAKDLARTFEQVRWGLFVGIGGAIPSDSKDVRLGDVVVSQSDGKNSAVVQYDMIKDLGKGHVEYRGHLNQPPRSLRNASASLQTESSKWISKYILDIQQREPDMLEEGYCYPSSEKDELHCRCGSSTSCGECENGMVKRPERHYTYPKIHYGVIASANSLQKNVVKRDELANRFGALCLEMEAAGLDDFPCLIIRGMCDYADEYKNDHWQEYAALVAAVYAKRLLEEVPPQEVKAEQTALQGIESLLQRQENRYLDDEHCKCHQAFKTSGYEQYKDDVKGKRVPGTCHWLLNNPRYQAWLEALGGDFLWVTADPGCGKSVLSRSLVEEGFGRKDSHPDVTTCYYFFKDNGEQDTLAPALCAVLHQLFDDQRQLIHHAMPAWKSNGTKIVTEVHELWRILVLASSDKQARLAICVLDALDECRGADRRSLIGMLCSYYKNARASPTMYKIKFLVTSRPYEDIEDTFHHINASPPSIRLRGEDCDEQLRTEIDLVARQRIKEIVEKFGLAHAAQTELEQRLVGTENRTYLWLHLVIDSIHKILKNTLRRKEVRFEMLPTSVDEAYEQILSKVVPEQVQNVRVIFRIMIGAPRPLTIGEMTLAFDVSTAVPKPESFTDLEIEEDDLRRCIRDWCGLFVFISHDRLFFIHQTAKEFLLGESKQASTNSTQWKHCLTPRDVNYELACVFIYYLCFEEFNSMDSKFDRKTKNINSGNRSLDFEHLSHRQIRSASKYGLFEMAASSWADHWRHTENVAPRILLIKAVELYNARNERFNRWAAFSEPIHRFLRFNGTDGLILAAYNNHTEIVRHMLKDRSLDIETKDGAGYTALTRAASTGGHETVKLLLASGADVHAGELNAFSLSTPLMAASAEGHDKVVQMLIDAGANINVGGRGFYSTALYAAPSRGHNEVVQWLLDAGINVDYIEADQPANALTAACRNGHGTVVERLLAAKADVNAKTPDGELSALIAASAYGHDHIVQRLLRERVDVNATGRYWGTALTTALSMGHVEVAQRLIDAGADVDIRTDRYNTTLIAASHGGCDQIVQLLLNQEGHVDIDANSEFGTALIAASAKGHVKAVEQLLAAKANVNAEGGFLRTALVAASAGGHDRVMRLLLDTGANVNAGGGDFSTSLTAASKRGYNTAVQMLLAAKADVNATSWTDGTALIAASNKGHDQVVRSLLAAGADVNIKSAGNRDTALMAAISSGSEQIVRQLLDAGAYIDTELTVHAERRHRDPALLWARLYGHDQIVKMLLEAGAQDDGEYEELWAPKIHMLYSENGDGDGYIDDNDDNHSDDPDGDDDDDERDSFEEEANLLLE